MSKREGPRELVLDTSVAVKFHVPEDQHEEARALRNAFKEGWTELLAPGTILPEAFNAFWQLHRRGELSREEVREGWDLISNLPLSLYAPEDLMPRAVELTFETGVIVYDALFLALAEDGDTVVLAADGKLLKALEGTLYARLTHPLADIASLIPSKGYYQERTATGLIRAGTQRTIRRPDLTKYLRISGLYGHTRTHWNDLTRIVAPKVAGSIPVGHPTICR